MKINWHRFIRTDRSNLLAGGYFLCIISVVTSCIVLQKPQIKYANDLAIVNGLFNNYTFVDGARGTHDYTFTLKDIDGNFQIEAEFIDLFSVNDFKRLPENTALTIAIPKVSLAKLNTPKFRLLVYSIKSDTTIYLDSADTIKAYNSIAKYIIVGAMLLVGIGLIYWGYTSPVK